MRYFGEMRNLVVYTPALPRRMSAITAAALLCLLAGWIVFRVAMPHIIVRIGT